MGYTTRGQRDPTTQVSCTAPPGARERLPYGPPSVAHSRSTALCFKAPISPHCTSWSPSPQRGDALKQFCCVSAFCGQQRRLGRGDFLECSGQILHLRRREVDIHLKTLPQPREDLLDASRRLLGGRRQNVNEPPDEPGIAFRVEPLDDRASVLHEPKQARLLGLSNHLLVRLKVLVVTTEFNNPLPKHPFLWRTPYRALWHLVRVA
mmetsp:Transcript_41023/g.108616  ORF Transcript_41023/g.108616 Transcript_41023/m.108616 type:complete len:207 (-) Transcript_41023:922-1542(-)